MGLMTELFLATRQEAIDDAGRNAEGLERVELGGLTSLEFGTLWAIVRGEPWDADRHELAELASTDDEWTFEFPAGYIEDLAALDDAKIEAVAEAWAATDEIGADVSEVLPIVREAVRLARSAAAKGRGLYLWFSL